MNCDDIEQELELFVLGELPPARQAGIRAHIAECSSCRNSARQYQLLVKEIKKTIPPVGPGAASRRRLWTAVDAQIRTERARCRRRRIMVAVGPLAAALTVGLAIWAVSFITRDRSEVVAVHPSLSAPAREQWRYSGALSAPRTTAYGVVMRDARMYLVRQEKRGSFVAAVDSETGRPLWQSTTASIGYLAADRSRVFCLASAGAGTLELVALDSSNGHLLWRYSSDTEQVNWSPCHPVPLEGEQLCWTTNRTVHMLRAKNGETVWTCRINDEGTLSCTAFQGQNLYVASGRRLHCLNPSSGEELWQEGFPTDLQGWGRPLLAVADRRIYLVQSRGAGSKLGCMDLDTRKLVWKKNLPWVQHLLAVGDGVYVRGQEVLAFDTGTGRQLWTSKAVGCGPLTALDGAIHFVDTSDGGRVVALDAHTGEETWQMSGVRSCDAFLRRQNTGYVKTQDGIIHAITLSGARQL